MSIILNFEHFLALPILNRTASTSMHVCSCRVAVPKPSHIDSMGNRSWLLSVPLTPGCPWVYAQAYKKLIATAQVLANLLSNGVKFTHAGEVVLVATIESSVSSDSDHSCDPSTCSPCTAPRLHVRITDTGIGLAPAALGRLFQDFRQGHESMSRRYGGTGYTGLRICLDLFAAS